MFTCQTHYIAHVKSIKTNYLFKYDKKVAILKSKNMEKSLDPADDIKQV